MIPQISVPGLTAVDLYRLHKRLFNETKTRQDIMDYEREIKSMDTAFSECPYPIFHSFADGMYTREIHFSKGHLVVGAIHKKEYFVTVLKGRIWNVSEFGAKDIIAPYAFKAKAGVKHVGFIVEDTVWRDTHKVESDNVEDAEKEIFADSYADLDVGNKVIEGEFSKMCSDLGLTEREVRAMSEIKEDLIDQPNDPIDVRKSPIEGLGVFATQDIKKGAKIALARLNDCRTPAGRYTNHSDFPNATGVIEGSAGYFVALEDISSDTEITADYRNIRRLSTILDGGALCPVG